MPSPLASHTSFMIDDRYIIIYGGTNGLRFFESIIRYEIEKKEWRMLTKYPKT